MASMAMEDGRILTNDSANKKPKGPTCGTTVVQPSYLAHARLIGCLVWTVHDAFYVP
jgi:hypothetical protein